MDWEHTLNSYTDGLLNFAPRLAGAIVVLIVGLWIVKKLLTIMDRLLEKSALDEEIRSFLSSLASLAMKFIIILIAAGIIGFEVSALIGVLAGVVFAIGLALQGFLGNFASGITIVFFKPYKIGDWVQIADFFGRVENIQIFNTTLVTPGDKTLIIPNGKVTEDIITNFSTRGHIRLELMVTMPYEESFPKVQQTIMETLQAYPKILKDPSPIIGIESFDSHNIIVSVRPYIHPDNYWEVTFDLNRMIKEAFYKKGIKVAYSEGVELGIIGE